MESHLVQLRWKIFLWCDQDVWEDREKIQDEWVENGEDESKMSD